MELRRLRGGPYGGILILIALLVAAPLVVLLFYPEESIYASSFFIPSGFAAALGGCVLLFAPRRDKDVREWQSPLQRGSLPVLFAWCFAILSGAAPFVLAGQLRSTLALFESVSGWTTTGLTVADVSLLPRIFLFHRSFMQFCGGMGFIIMIAMLLRGKQAMYLYSAEGHPDKLMPNLKDTARAIFLLQSGFLAFGALMYIICGMEPFDALCHTMSALSTAGFTTRAGSIGAYGSVLIEAVTIVLMLAGASNFAILLLLVKGKFKKAFHASEVRFMLGLILIFTPLCALSLHIRTGAGVFESIRGALFGVVTTFTTTGYSTMDYSVWPAFALGLLILLMIIGGSAGSTAGGIKLIRAYLLIRIALENVRSRVLPARSVTAPSYFKGHEKTPINAALVSDTTGFVVCYTGVLILGTLLLAATTGCGLLEAMFEFASAFGTVGISNGLTGPRTPPAALIVEMAGMLLGRLEIFIVFIGLASAAHELGSAARKAVRPFKGRTASD